VRGDTVGIVMLVLGHGDDRPGNELNSLASLDLLRRIGVDGIECDVRRTSDEQLAVRHDATLPDGRLVSSTHSRDLPADVPLLPHVLDRCEGLLVNVEIKNFRSDAAFDATERVTHLLVDLLDRRGSRDDVLVSCFGPAALDVVRARAPLVSTATLLLSRRPSTELLDDVVARGHRIVHPYDTMVDRDFVEQARSRGLEVNVWVGPDLAEQRLLELVALEVDGLITDDPARALRAAGR
jgi:glycerophosphoryl diester phosphodiesterase